MKTEKQQMIENFCAFLSEVKKNSEREKIVLEVLRLLTEDVEPKHYTALEYDVISSNMIKYGGSFVKQLGELIIRADQTNRGKLAIAFPNYFNEYLIFS